MDQRALKGGWRCQMQVNRHLEPKQKMTPRRPSRRSYTAWPPYLPDECIQKHRCLMLIFPLGYLGAASRTTGIRIGTAKQNGLGPNADRQ